LQPSNGASKEELVLYEDLALYLTYYRIWPDLLKLIHSTETAKTKQTNGAIAFYDEHAKTFEHFFQLPGVRLPSGHDAAHIFAISFQIRRAFRYIFTRIAGSNLPRQIAGEHLAVGFYA